MAKRLKNFDFGPSRRGRPDKYPWSDWTDGDVWEASKDVDYDISDDSFRSVLRTRARHEGCKVVLRCPKPGTIIFQYYDVDEPTR
jgi:hypothetical protein